MFQTQRKLKSEQKDSKMPKPKGRKKYSEAQKRIARIAKPRNVITGADFKALRKRKKRR